MRIIQPSYYLKRALHSTDFSTSVENLQYFNKYIVTALFDIGQKYQTALQQYVKKFVF